MFAFVLAAVLSHGEAGELDKRAPVDKDDTVDAIWKSRCDGCHKADGHGKPDDPSKEKRVPDLSTAEWQTKHSADDVRASIQNGVKDTKMRGYKGKMTTAQLDAVVAKVKAFKK
jgi:mono/diheme cytochrome c family protein